jgi:hypothetical protein
VKSDTDRDLTCVGGATPAEHETNALTRLGASPSPYPICRSHMEVGIDHLNFSSPLQLRWLQDNAFEADRLVCSSSSTQNNSQAHRYIDIPGPTFLTYTPNGRKLITAGLNNAIRVFQSGSDAEPTNIDDCQDSNAAIVATVRPFPPTLSARLRRELE